MSGIVEGINKSPFCIWHAIVDIVQCMIVSGSSRPHRRYFIDEFVVKLLFDDVIGIGLHKEIETLCVDKFMKTASIHRLPPINNNMNSDWVEVGIACAQRCYCCCSFFFSRLFSMLNERWKFWNFSCRHGFESDMRWHGSARFAEWRHSVSNNLRLNWPWMVYKHIT